MKLIKPAFDRMRNSEFLLYHNQVLEICGSGIQALALPINALKAAVAEIDELFMPSLSNPLTAELEALDARRDRALTGLRKLADACAYHFDEATSLAGKTIVEGIDKYGKKLTVLNYAAETEVIESLVASFSTQPAMVAAANTLPLVKAWVQELDTANRLFNDTNLNRVQSNARKPNQSFTQLRSSTIDTYQQLAAQITAQQTIAPSELMATLIKRLNSLTAQYNRLVNNRSSLPDEQPGDDEGK